MITYQIVDFSIDYKNISVEYTDTVSNDKSIFCFSMPRLNRRWLSGEDLDRWIKLSYPSSQNIDPNQLNNQTKEQFLKDQQWLVETYTEDFPSNLPNEVIDSVIRYKQSVYLESIRKNCAMGYALFDQPGSYQWTVPPDETKLNFYIRSVPMPTWEQGPGGCFSLPCQVVPGDVITINLGTQTTVSSSLGTITVESGWGKHNLSPENYFYVEPWGFPGKSGCVIIY